MAIGFAATFLACRHAQPAASPGHSPSVEGIAYEHPERYLDVSPSIIGNPRRFADAVTDIVGGDDDVVTVRQILVWERKHLKLDASFAYKWRTVDEILRDGAIGGCADESVVVGELARAKRIPTVWVKTMDVSWIWRFRENPAVSSWDGHVFLELFIKGDWRLLDASEGVFYWVYTPSARILPGNRLAYDKGGDPFGIVLSVRWQEWLREANSFFSSLDPSVLPVNTARISTKSLFPKINIIGEPPVVSWISDTATDEGFSVNNIFNWRFEQYLPASRRQTIVFTVVGNETSLPREYWNEYSPLSEEEVAGALRERRYGFAAKILSDETRVIVIYARDIEALHEALRLPRFASMLATP